MEMSVTFPPSPAQRLVLNLSVSHTSAKIHSVYIPKKHFASLSVTGMLTFLCPKNVGVCFLSVCRPNVNFRETWHDD